MEKPIKMKKSDPKSMAGKPLTQAERFGQVFTPQNIAAEMVNILLDNRKSEPISILDPCVGPFTFPKEIINNKYFNSVDSLTIIDIDEEMIEKTRNSLDSFQINCEILNEDYLTITLNKKYDFIILNPPYIRQEWIEKKPEYQSIFSEKYNMKVPGTSNLYVYFIVKAIHDLKLGGKFVCIIYDSWQNTIYGKWLINFLNSYCSSIQVQSVNNQPFQKKLIDATIISGVKTGLPNEADYCSLEKTTSQHPKGPFFNIPGFSTISSLLRTKRGLRLKQANFFLCDHSKAQEIGATPFVKKVGKINGFIVPENHSEAALLISTSHQYENHLAHKELNKRIETAKKNPEKNVSILTWYNTRPDSWYLHGDPPYAPIIFNYYLRNRPRHIYNPNRAYSDNFYGLQVKNDFLFTYLAVLNSTSVCVEILANSRNQGNGLAKIQLFEYRNVCIPDLEAFNKHQIEQLNYLGLKLIDNPDSSKKIINEIDSLIYTVFKDERLHPSHLSKLYNQLCKR